jgi:condensin complex subunit 3
MDADECIQIDMAEDIIRILFGKDLTVEIESASMQPFSSYILILDAEEDKKVLCQLLNKLYIPDVVDDHKIRSLKLLMDNLRAVSSPYNPLKAIMNRDLSSQRRPLRDSVCNNAFTKFETLITKKFENQLEHFSEEEFRKLEELNELFMFLDSIIPMEDDDDDIGIPRRSRKRYVGLWQQNLGLKKLFRRSGSFATTTSESRSRSPDTRTSKHKHRTK